MMTYPKSGVLLVRFPCIIVKVGLFLVGSCVVPSRAQRLVRSDPVGVRFPFPILMGRTGPEQDGVYVYR